MDQDPLDDTRRQSGLTEAEAKLLLEAPYFHKRCCLQIGDTMQIGSGSLPISKEHGQTFRRNETVNIRSALARICIAHAIWSNDSSTRSNSVDVSRSDTTNSRQTIWRSLSLHQSEFGCVLMSPRLVLE
jgi:hypothetical protein